MPRMGRSVMEGVVKRWLVQEGDSVKRYQPVAEVSSRKVTIEIVAPVTGIIQKILTPAGNHASIGEPLALIEEEVTK